MRRLFPYLQAHHLDAYNLTWSSEYLVQLVLVCCCIKARINGKQLINIEIQFLT